MWRIKFLLATLTCCFFFSACAGEKEFPNSPRYIPHPSGRLPIVASYAFYNPFITDVQFEWVKEAGFNTVNKMLYPSDLDSLLRVAERHDVYVISSIPGMLDEKNTRSYVAPYNDVPQLWAFSMGDEPSAERFPTVAENYGRLSRYAPDKLPYTNLLPAVGSRQLGTSGYKDYVEDFVMEVNPPFLCFDAYPVQKDAQGRVYVNDIFYRSIEVVSDVARRSGRPFWSYILANRHAFYPKPKEDYIRFQAFSALAYGAQGLLYFTYLMPDFDKGKGEFSDAPIDWNGRRTPVWSMVRNVNAEIRNLEPVFLGAEVVDVSHTGSSIPKGTKRLRSLPSPYISLDSDGEGVMVSQLRNGDENYLVVINRDINRRQKVSVEVSQPVVRLLGNGSEKVFDGGSVTLSPGGYAIFRQ